MITEERHDIAVIGGGIVGLATAMELSRVPGLRLVVLEAEGTLAAHQTGHNSGVVHSGLYYRPGSLKARNCVSGREELYRFCEAQGVCHERCGKVVVATHSDEIPRLHALEERGRANGLQGLERLGPEGIREREPHAGGIEGLYVPDTGIVDFPGVAVAYAEVVRQHGGHVETGARLLECAPDAGAFVLETTQGSVRCRHLVACAGLQADRVARLCGVDPGVRIVPFRGEYKELLPERQYLVRNLIYPVPDPRFPFLGVHLTRMVRGGVEAGPNAILAWKREGYERGSFAAADVMEWLSYAGFWRMGLRHWRRGLGESWRSFSHRAFVAALRRLVPELRPGDLRPAGAGVRAMALAPDGRLLDDFHLVESERMIHVLNAPSPAATASIAIGQDIASRARKRFGLRAPEASGRG